MADQFNIAGKGGGYPHRPGQDKRRQSRHHNQQMPEQDQRSGNSGKAHQPDHDASLNSLRSRP